MKNVVPLSQVRGLCQGIVQMEAAPTFMRETDSTTADTSQWLRLRGHRRVGLFK